VADREPASAGLLDHGFNPCSSPSSTVRFRISRSDNGLRKRDSGVAPCDDFHKGGVLDAERQGYGQSLTGRDRAVALLDSLDAGRDGHAHGPEYGSVHSLQVAAQQNLFPRLLASVYCRAARSLSVAAHSSLFPWPPIGLAVPCLTATPGSYRTHALGSSHRTCGRSAASPAASSPSATSPPRSRVACTVTSALLPSDLRDPFAAPTCCRSALSPSPSPR
jgi:hypothetical protein